MTGNTVERTERTIKLQSAGGFRVFPAFYKKSLKIAELFFEKVLKLFAKSAKL